jgi:hypothetical protein
MKKFTSLSVPLAWSWRLSDATPEQRAKYKIIGNGHGVHWPNIDEDISTEGMLYGVPAPRPVKSKHAKKIYQEIAPAYAVKPAPLTSKVRIEGKTLVFNYNCIGVYHLVTFVTLYFCRQ